MTSVNLSKEHPAVYQSVVALEESIQQAAKAASIDPKLVENQTGVTKVWIFA